MVGGELEEGGGSKPNSSHTSRRAGKKQRKERGRGTGPCINTLTRNVGCRPIKKKPVGKWSGKGGRKDLHPRFLRKKTTRGKIGGGGGGNVGGRSIQTWGKVKLAQRQIKWNNLDGKKKKAQGGKKRPERAGGNENCGMTRSSEEKKSKISIPLGKLKITGRPSVQIPAAYRKPLKGER